MARFDDVARERSDLSEADVEHLRRLVGDWNLLADLAFADLVLWLPTWHGGGFVAADQVRPSTGPTVFADDIVGDYVPRGRNPLLARALTTGVVVPYRDRAGPVGPAAEEAVPISSPAGRTIAVLSRHGQVTSRGIGAMETAYLQAADALVEMVRVGEFPAPTSLAGTPTPPRVGDGLIRIDASGRVSYASPNARSAYHRLGLAADLTGVDLARTTARLARRPGPVDERLAAVTAARAPGGAEVENARAVLTLRGVPLLSRGRPDGGLVLVRDATEIRDRDRALVGKDAAIREIHHRVKNNLQTVAALLRMQVRRIDSAQGRAALEEAVRRVSAIAVVHEALATSSGEHVDADDVVDRVMALVRDLAAHEQDTTVRREGSFGELPSQVVTSLAVVLGELLANAVEHGGTMGANGVAGPAQVVVRPRRRGAALTVTVSDRGPGIPAAVDPFASGRLGLAIVRTLVTDELGGTLELRAGADAGTDAVVRIALREGRERAD